MAAMAAASRRGLEWQRRRRQRAAAAFMPPALQRGAHLCQRLQLLGDPVPLHQRRPVNHVCLLPHCMRLAGARAAAGGSCAPHRVSQCSWQLLLLARRRFSSAAQEQCAACASPRLRWDLCAVGLRLDM